MTAHDPAEQPKADVHALGELDPLDLFPRAQGTSTPDCDINAATSDDVEGRSNEHLTGDP
jgi:hypothetical protein